MDERRTFDAAQLQQRAKDVNRETLTLGTKNGGYHFGGSFSATHLLVALYDVVMREEDKFVLSKGHGCWPLYVLLRERGLNPELGGHPSFDPSNGIWCTTGSEGHGLPTVLGMAKARKMQGRPGHFYVIIGDGECQEGTTWEALLTGANQKLDNVTCIIDWNGIQGSGYVRDILPLPDMGKIGELIGWSVTVIDGHKYEQIIPALQDVTPGKPHLIVAHTIKGKGVTYMEDVPQWHAKFPNPQEMEQALKELT
jgi:transketolase